MIALLKAAKSTKQVAHVGFEWTPTLMTLQACKYITQPGARSHVLSVRQSKTNKLSFSHMTFQ